ncbi:DUF3267 domain-containing protein [Macrococcoides caseolyticum]|uniref:DUF3267 domain-containing protein n=1 Tax=Macrococcoides caseolyticum TaxID=69966 RepID=UPI001F2CE85B|nr:DUF3267 domain-containing protein [Macrococcus caseolyticus]MCE4957667.1 DUF3267 domain-containing protein [Macrococcus caseolyticus]
MYLCNKNFNIRATYGLQRILLISTLIAILVFIVSFEVFSSVFGKHFSDQYFLLFMVACVAVYPVHKCLHLLPFLNDTKSMIFQKTNKSKWLPLINIRLNHPIHKTIFGLSLVLPFFILSVITLTCAVLFTDFAHYFLFLFSANVGISFIDFIYLKYIINTPKGSYIEERKYGFEILTKHEFSANFHECNIR